MSAPRLTLLSSPATLTPTITLQTLPLAANMVPLPSFCPTLTYQEMSPTSSSHGIARSSPRNAIVARFQPYPSPPLPRLFVMPHHSRISTGSPSHSLTSIHVSKLPVRRQAAWVKPYPLHLTIIPSPLREHVSARDRLIKWTPATTRTAVAGLSTMDVQRLHDVITFAYADGTLKTYGSGLLWWHVFCDRRAVPEVLRCPAPTLLVSSFIAMLAGSYAGGTISGYVAGVRAWHIIHGAVWAMKDDELDALLRAADALAPESSKRKKCLPYTISVIETLLSHFNLDIPLDAAVAACLSTTFYSAARLGEFTVRTLTSFDPKIHVKPSDVEMVTAYITQRRCSTLIISPFTDDRPQRP